MLDSLLGMPRAGGWVNKDPTDDYWYMPRGVDTVSGAEISEDTALGIPTVFSCVAKVSKSIAALPVDVIEKTGPRSRKRVDHPLDELLDGSANEEASGMTLREALSGNHELWGDAYCHIDWRYSGRNPEPARLTLLQSRHVDLKRDSDTGKIVFIYKDDRGMREVLPYERVWMIPGFGINGIRGLSVIGWNREALGLAMATTQFASAFFGNGAWAGGFFTRPLEAPELSREAGEKFLDDINDKFRGSKKAFGFGLLREAMDFKQIDMPFEDAMFLNMQKSNRVEICGMFDVPLIMIQDGEFSTFSNTEQADIAFSKHTLAPRCARIERAAYHRFFKGTKLRLKHNLAGLERGDFKTRMEGYAKGRQWGLYSINDIRAMEDLNPIDGGDTYLEPLNMKPAGQPTPVQNGSQRQQALETITLPHRFPAAVAEDAEDQRHRNAMDIVRPMVEHAADRIATRQCKAASTAWKKHAKGGRPETFAEWADKFFVGHAEVVYAELCPIVEAYQIAGGEVQHIDPKQEAGKMCRAWQSDMGSDPIVSETVIKNWKHDLSKQIASHVCGILDPQKEHENEK